MSIPNPAGPPGPGLKPYETLLRAALGNGDSALSAYVSWSAGFSPADVVDPGEFSLLSAVAGNVTRHGGMLDDEVGNRIRGISRRTWSSNNLRLETTRGVINALRSTGAEVLIGPGPLGVLIEFDEVAVTALDHVELWVKATHAPRAVSALMALGAATQLGLEPFFDARSCWQQRFYATLDGCGFLLRWNADSDHLFPPATICMLSTFSFSTLPLQERIWEYLLRASEPLSADGDPTTRLRATIALDRAIRRAASEQSAPGWEYVLGERAHRAQNHAHLAAALRWLQVIDPTPELTKSTREFIHVVPRPAVTSPVRVQTTTPRSAFAFGYRLVAHARVYRAACIARNARTTVLGFGRYMAGRALLRVKRTRKL